MVTRFRCTAFEQLKGEAVNDCRQQSHDAFRAVNDQVGVVGDSRHLGRPLQTASPENPSARRRATVRNAARSPRSSPMNTIVRAPRSSTSSASAPPLSTPGGRSSRTSRLQVQVVAGRDGVEDGAQFCKRAGRISGATGVNRERPALVLDPDALRKREGVDRRAGRGDSRMLRRGCHLAVAASQRSAP